MPNPVEKYGFSALPRDPSVILKGKKHNAEPQPISINDVKLPDTPLATAVRDYARGELREETYNHSMRVYYYGMAMAKQQFPSWLRSEETYFLTCMLHDIGTTSKNLRATMMSFEFYGGLLARDLLHREWKAPIEQAESVAEVRRAGFLGRSKRGLTRGRPSSGIRILARRARLPPSDS